MDAPKRLWAWVDELAGVVGGITQPETPQHLPAGPNAISPCCEYILAAEHDHLMAEKDAEIERLRDALIDAAAHLVGAASAYTKYACRSKTVGRGQPDPFFKTRLADFNNAAKRARTAIIGDALKSNPNQE